ncbi:8-oxo-dGTP pyrophosphatase MutT (NUDIX family) [Knoellia remsis]|uniref:8-oxo-dGTP pyrophosphatase MutT (NUDIX family) n=1 Tax=Knoellia remsis TaxID=407159 RepID=A0A2T0UYQ7_9MICO|nr:NUDIX hydrolase [Knoellia remsis]PRY62968.1 8-oxo-dGTP pyrophosphatase MutT (NUDIX family) [Knoellia remsis]
MTVGDTDAAAPATGAVNLARRFAHLRSDAIATLGTWQAPDASQERLRTAYLDHLERHPAGVAKGGPEVGGVPAHLTASCLVISPDGGHVLLTHHKRARQWFQFGGHLEPTDSTLLAAATREGREESGIPTVAPAPYIVQLDRHELHGDFPWCREHLDVRFAAVIERNAVPETSAESLDVAWWPVDALPEGTRDELSRLVAAARAALSL